MVSLATVSKRIPDDNSSARLENYTAASDGAVLVTVTAMAAFASFGILLFVDNLLWLHRHVDNVAGRGAEATLCSWDDQE